MNVNTSQTKVRTVLNTVLFTIVNPVYVLESEGQSTSYTLRCIM
jgi:hypothetical protein